MQNTYPEKPMVAYERTAVTMPDVIDHLGKIEVPTELERSAYIIFRIESGNGHDGINNNYVGAQADGARWPAMWDTHIVGVVEEVENRGKDRLFVAFDTWESCVEFLAERLLARGIFIGGHTDGVTNVAVKDETDLVVAYYREWVTGNATATPPGELVTSFESMYAQAKDLFPVYI